MNRASNCPFVGPIPYPSLPLDVRRHPPHKALTHRAAGLDSDAFVGCVCVCIVAQQCDCHTTDGRQAAAVPSHGSDLGTVRPICRKEAYMYSVVSSQSVGPDGNRGKAVPVPIISDLQRGTEYMYRGNQDGGNVSSAFRDKKCFRHTYITILPMIIYGLLGCVPTLPRRWPKTGT